MGCPADGELEQGVAAHRVAIVRIFVHTGDREPAEAQHRRQAVDDRVGVAPLPDAAGQRLCQPEPALRRAQQD